MSLYSLLRQSLTLVLLAGALAAPFAFAQESDLSVTKSGPALAAAGDDVTYSVTVTNLGPDDAATVTVLDPTPAGMTSVSASPGAGFSCSISPTLITCVSVTPLLAFTSATFSFVFNIPAATPPGTIFSNTATSASPTDFSSENDSGFASTSTPGLPQADIGVTKSGPANAGPDTDVIYTIVVTNSGPDAASGVTLSDPLPVTMTFVSLTQTGTVMVCTDPGVGNSGTVSCTAATYPAGGTTTLTLTGHIPPGTASGTPFTNIASVSATSTDPNSENNSSQTDLLVSSVDVFVAKSGTATVTAGNNVTYSLDITNSGPDTAANVVLNDPLPPGTTYVSLVQNTGPSASCTLPPPGVSCLIPALGSGATANFTLVVKAGDTTSITNTVTGSTESFDSNHANDSASATTTVTPSADLAVTKNGPATATAGMDITYTVTVTNGGPSTATAVSLTDTLPPNTTFVSLNQTVGPTFSCGTPGVGGTGTITCTIAALSPTASATFSIVLHLVSSAPGGSLANTATVSAATADPDSGNNSATWTATTTVSADLRVVKSGPDSVTAGSTVTYSVVVTNNGPSDAATVALTDLVPSGTTFGSATQTTGPAFTCGTPPSGGTGTITCSIASLASGASATFSIVLNVLPATTGSISNTASVGASTTDPDGTNNSSTKTTTIVTGADVSVVKSGPAAALAGSTVTYSVAVSNSGPSDAANVTLTDTLPPGTTFVSETQTSGPVFICSTPAVDATGTIMCTIATLANGASATFSMVLRVSPFDTGGQIVNTADVSSTTPDPTPANGTSTALTAVIALVTPPIPTLSSLALVLLGLTLALAGILVFRARRPFPTR